MSNTNADFARHFATDWIDSWNCHDLDRIMAHYGEGVEFSGPFVARIAGEPSGILKGKARIRAYWEQALKLVPDLRFELVSTLTGIDSIVLFYKNQKEQFNAETFHFGKDRLVYKSAAHGAIPPIL